MMLQNTFSEVADSNKGINICMTWSLLYVIIWHLVKEKDDIHRSHKVDVTVDQYVTSSHRSLIMHLGSHTAPITPIVKMEDIVPTQETSCTIDEGIHTGSIIQLH